MNSIELVYEFLECVDMYDVDTCEKLYKDLDRDGKIKKTIECLKRCECIDEEITGVTPMDDDFCKKNCVCVEE